MQTINVKVLGVNKYSFQEQGTNRTIEGCNVHFINEESTETERNVGFLPKKATLPYEAYETFIKKEFPFKAKAYLTVDFNGQKPQLKITNFEEVKNNHQK